MNQSGEWVTVRVKRTDHEDFGIVFLFGLLACILCQQGGPVHSFDGADVADQEVCGVTFGEEGLAELEDMFVKVLLVTTDPFDTEDLAVCDAGFAGLGVRRIVWEVVVCVGGFGVQVGVQLVVPYAHQGVQEGYAGGAVCMGELDVVCGSVEVLDELLEFIRPMLPKEEDVINVPQV